MAAPRAAMAGAPDRDGPALRAFVRRRGDRRRAGPPPVRRRPARRGPSGIRTVVRAGSAEEHRALVRAWAAEVRRAG